MSLVCRRHQRMLVSALQDYTFGMWIWSMYHSNPRWTRITDLYLIRVALYQLSYEILYISNPVSTYPLWGHRRFTRSVPKILTNNICDVDTGFHKYNFYVNIIIRHFILTLYPQGTNILPTYLGEVVNNMLHIEMILTCDFVIINTFETP